MLYSAVLPQTTPFPHGHQLQLPWTQSKIRSYYYQNRFPPRTRPFLPHFFTKYRKSLLGSSSFDSSAPPSFYDDDGDDFDVELGRLLALLPEEMRRRISEHPELHQLIEVVMDLGRKPLARFPSRDFVLSDLPIMTEDIQHATSQSDEEPGNRKEEAGEIQSSGERWSCSIVNVTKLDVPVSGSDEHGTFVEAVLSADREPAQSPDVTDRMLGQGSGLLVADTSGGDCSTTVDNSGCPVQVQSQLVVGSDLNFPIFEVGRGLIDSEVPRLNWDDSLFSDKGEEAVNPEVITPLALWDPKGFHDLVSGSDGCSVEEVLEPSEWSGAAQLVSGQRVGAVWCLNTLRYDDIAIFEKGHNCVVAIVGGGCLVVLIVVISGCRGGCCWCCRSNLKRSVMVSNCPPISAVLGIS
nr:uncharacterized protein ycf45 [Quercus suber]